MQMPLIVDCTCFEEFDTLTRFVSSHFTSMEGWWDTEEQREDDWQRSVKEWHSRVSLRFDSLDPSGSVNWCGTDWYNEEREYRAMPHISAPDFLEEIGWRAPSAVAVDVSEFL